MDGIFFKNHKIIYENNIIFYIILLEIEVIIIIKYDSFKEYLQLNYLDKLNVSNLNLYNYSNNNSVM